jgi:FKBP-type peptidyl-prolyl cis-trans isomerase
MKNKVSFLILISILVLIGCSDKGKIEKQNQDNLVEENPQTDKNSIDYNSDNLEWFIDKSGLEYCFLYESDIKQKAKYGDVLELELMYSYKDSVLFDSRYDLKRDKFYKEMKRPSHAGGSIEDAFALMSPKDELLAKVDAYNFYIYNRLYEEEEIPDFIKKGEPLTFRIKLLSIRSIEDVLDEARGIKINSHAEEKKFLDEYLKMTNTTQEPTESGLYFIEKKAGKGPKAKEGDLVVLHYFMFNAFTQEPFHDTYSTGQPIEFIVGENKVIEGFEEAAKFMSKGTEAKLIIPSKLAYDSVFFENKIPPYTTLVFDEVRVLDVISAEELKKYAK